MTIFIDIWMNLVEIFAITCWAIWNDHQQSFDWIVFVFRHCNSLAYHIANVRENYVKGI